MSHPSVVQCDDCSTASAFVVTHFSPAKKNTRFLFVAFCEKLKTFLFFFLSTELPCLYLNQINTHLHTHGGKPLNPPPTPWLSSATTRHTDSFPFNMHHTHTHTNLVYLEGGWQQSDLSHVKVIKLTPEDASEHRSIVPCP